MAIPLIQILKMRIFTELDRNGALFTSSAKGVLHGRSVLPIVVLHGRSVLPIVVLQNILQTSPDHLN